MAHVPHMRATFKGEFKASAGSEPYEQWNTSVALRRGGNYATESRQGIANDLLDDFRSLMSAGNGFAFGASVWLREVRLDSIGSNGRIDADPVFAVQPGDGFNVSGPTLLPPSCAVVLTLDTKQRGRSRFGRMYLPMLGVPVNATGGMAEAEQTAILNMCRTFIENVGNAPGIDDDFAVAVASGVGDGALNTVREVRVGRVIDTMRSRRRSLDEAYLTATIST